MESLLEEIKKGSIAGVKKCIEDNTYSIDNLNVFLDVACQCGQKEIINILISNGADIHHNSESSLTEAILYNNGVSDKETGHKLIHLLIDLGADINNLYEDYIELIIDTCTVSLIEYLLQIGMNLTLKMFYYATEIDNLNAFKLFYNKMSDTKDCIAINLFDIWNTACRCGSMEIIDYMLDLPFDFDLDNRYLIQCTIKENKIDIFKKILNRIPDPKTIININALKWACIKGNFEMIKIILDLGINPNELSENDSLKFNTVLELTLSSDNHTMDIVKLLLNHNANVTILSLINVAQYDNFDTFKLIYHSGEWTMNQLSSILYEIISNDCKVEYWKFLQKEVGLQLEFKYLKKIINYFLSYGRRNSFEYFVHFYGKETIFELIDLEICSDNAKAYLQTIFKH